MTVSAVAAFLLVQVLAVPLHGVWVVLTAVFVTQASVGGSIGASLEYVLGTLAGALYATLVALIIPHTTPLATAGVLALSIAPLACAAALSTRFRVAPFTAVIVLLLAGQFGKDPVTAAAIRLSDVVLGAAVGVLVSLALFPERASRRTREAAVLVLQQLAHALPRLLGGFSAQSDPADMQRMQDALGNSVASFDALVTDARHEQRVSFGLRPNVGALSRTLLKLRDDWVIIGSAATCPFAQALLSGLSPRLAALGSIVEDYLLATAGALSTGGSPPSAAQVDAPVNGYTSEVTAIRAAGLTKALSATELEQLFTLGFALDQMRSNLIDLERCVREWRAV